VTALTKIVDHILKEMDQGNYTGVLFLDFKKAFDMVNHTIWVTLASLSFEGKFPVQRRKLKMWVNDS
jgi:hypothetical protein